MLGYIVRRTGWAVALFLVVTMYTYILFFLMPYEAFQLGARGSGITGEASTVRDSVGTRGSFFEEYGTFVWRIVHGDLLYAVLDPRVRLHERSPRELRTAQQAQAETTRAPAVASP